MSERVKIGLVGIAGFGEWYIRSLLTDPKAPQLDWMAAADPAPERCRQLAQIKEIGVPIYPSLAELLRQQRPELLVLCTPIHLHAEQTAMATQAGVAVLCEKPLAGGLDDALRIIRAQEESRRRVSIGYQWSFRRAIQRLKGDILAGRFGFPKRLKTFVSYPRPYVYFARNSWVGRINTPDGRPVLDSPVNNATAHFLHNMLYLLGPTWNTSLAPAAVQAELYRANDIENYDNAALRCQMPGGTEVLFFTAHSIPERRGPQCHFEFELATITFDPSQRNAQFVAQFSDGGTSVYGSPDDDRTEKIWQCAAAVRSGSESACPAHAALPHTLTVIAAQESMPEMIDLPASARRESKLEPGPMRSIDGLSEAFSRAFEKGVLPAELGDIPWAGAGRVVPVEVPEVLRASQNENPEVV